MSQPNRINAGDASIAEVAGDPSAESFIPASIAANAHIWLSIAGPLFSVGILSAVLWRLHELHLAGTSVKVPTAPLFWLVFAVYYFTLPVAEFVIFRRLWRIPAAGITALLRKRLSNELLLGYSGELYFYAWARRRADLTAAPFGAIKDVAILSALAGNVATIVLVAATAPVFGLDLGIPPRVALLAAIGIVGPAFVAMLLRGHLFSLPMPQIRMALGVHFVRIITTSLLLALLWHLALPDVAVVWWIALVALQMLVSRLPLVPNKDVVFAGICVMLIGHDPRVVELMAMIAGLTLVAHILVGIVLTARDLGRQRLDAQ